MNEFHWFEFFLGFIVFPFIVAVVLLLKIFWKNWKEKRELRERWIESYKHTDEGIKLLSKDKGVVDVIPSESLYSFEGGIRFTTMGDALKMTFLLKGDKNYSRGLYFVEYRAANELRYRLQEA